MKETAVNFTLVTKVKDRAGQKIDLNLKSSLKDTSFVFRPESSAAPVAVLPLLCKVALAE